MVGRVGARATNPAVELYWYRMHRVKHIGAEQQMKEAVELTLFEEARRASA